jgi:glycosyltransferase involved in cell wall biosynthesis
MFSVIIPLYNKQSFIRQTIRSVLRQTYTNFEIIIVNDSSTDNGLLIANQFHDPRIHLYTIPNGGVSLARNYGISMAQGEMLAFLDADDCWEPEYLDNMNKFMKLYPNVGLYASAYYTFSSGKKVSVNKFHFGDKENYKLIDYFKSSVDNGLSINITSATCIRKKIFENVSAFRPHISRGEDLDVWLRIALRYPVAYSNKELVYYRSNTFNSLATHYTRREDEFPYEEWLKYKSSNHYYLKYVTLVIYMFAKSAFLNKDYSTCHYYACLIKGNCIFFKLWKRVALLFLSAIKIKINKK